jgi:SAM-dependent methyltransferase
VLHENRDRAETFGDDAGRDVLGVEVDDRMAAIARGYGIKVETGRFETWDAAGRHFDLVTSAQAWHWVEPTVGAAKAAAVLEPDGRIALWWNVASPPDDIHGALTDAYARVAPGIDAESALLAGGGSARFALAGDSLGANGAFTDPEIRSFPHDRTYTTAEWLDQLPTHSVHRQLSPERLAELLQAVAGILDDAGGSFVMHYDTWLVTALRRD